MRINLVLELMDTPGQLVKALEPVSSLGANLVTVIHKRDYKNEKGNVPVQLTIEGEQEDLKNVVNRFEELGFSIIEMDGVVLKEKITTILFGHIVDQDLRDTMDRINDLDEVEIVAFDIKLNGEEKTAELEDNRLLIEEPEENLTLQVTFANLSISIGDVNGDGTFDKKDINCTANQIIKNYPVVFYDYAADVNDDGIINITDIIIMIDNLKKIKQ